MNYNQAQDIVNRYIAWREAENALDIDSPSDVALSRLNVHCAKAITRYDDAMMAFLREWVKDQAAEVIARETKRK